jgi:hypothetical protein
LISASFLDDDFFSKPYFSDTVLTPMAGLKTPLSRIIQVLTARSEGMGLNATARTFKVSKKSVIDWEWR